MSDQHEPRWRGTGYGGGRMVCRCGDDCEDGYNAHVEPIVAERIAQARRGGAANEVEALADRWEREADVICPPREYDEGDKAWRVAHVRRRCATDLRAALRGDA